jgi:hypothetical protein
VRFVADVWGTVNVREFFFIVSGEVERAPEIAAILMYMFNSGVRNFELMCYVNAVQAMRAEGWNKE